MSDLDSVPDDVLFLILAQLESAREVAHLARTCSRLHRFVKSDGWRIFARARFPSRNLTLPPKLGWADLADSLTWQSRCWDRRSLVFSGLLPTCKGRPRSSELFEPALAAHVCAETGEEVVAWGAGNKNLVARYRKGKTSAEFAAVPEWRRLEGEINDDVTALSFVESPRGRAGELGLLAGRNSGKLSLLSASRDGFGEVISTFSDLEPSSSDAVVPAAARGRFNPLNGRNKMCSVDVSPSDRVVAVAQPNHLHLYPLPQGETAQSQEIRPVSSLNLWGEKYANSHLRSAAKWMAGGDLIAVAGPIREKPLGYVKVTPHGLTPLISTVIDDCVEERLGLDMCINPTSLQPLLEHSVTGGRGSLVLGGWRHGTVRLLDIRTPGPFDQVYQDNIDPSPDLHAILPLDNTRFVAGGIGGSTLKVFDFRWPRNYTYTAALPCSNETPFPEPPQPFRSRPADPTAGRKCCDHLLGLRCKWHHLSRDLYYRPNAKFFIGRELRAGTGIWHLARGAATSPNFYIGVTGGVVEAGLQSSDGRGDASFGFDQEPPDPAPAAEVGYTTKQLYASVMETGDGKASSDCFRSIRLPELLSFRGTGSLSDASRPPWSVALDARAGSLSRCQPGQGAQPYEADEEMRRKCHRLDTRLQGSPGFPTRHDRVQAERGRRALRWRNDPPAPAPGWT